MKKVKKIIYGILMVVIFTVLPFIVFALITSKTDVIAGIRSFVVLSGSMQPTIPTGSIVYAQKNAFYQSGDVVTFEKSGVVVTHRIVELVNKNGSIFYKTRGDANNAADSGLINASSVLGKQIFFVPYLGRFVMFLKTLPGFIVFVILPAIIFIGFEFWNIKKEIEKNVEKKLMERVQVT